jgi:hypothetical protein
LFCLTALVAFLLAVIASGSLLSSYETVSIVTLRWPEGYFQKPSAEAQTPALPRETLLAAAAKVGLDESALGELFLQPWSDSSIVRVAIRYRDADPTRSSTFVSEVAEEFVAGHHRQAQRHLQQVLAHAREQIERTQQERWRLVEEIDQYLKQALPQLRISHNSWDTDPYRKRLRLLAAPPHAEVQGVLLASGHAQHDAVELRTEIAELEARVKALLEHLTPEHPKVQILRHEIELLRGSLLNVAPHDPPQQPDTAPPVNNGPTGTSPSPPKVSPSPSPPTNTAPPLNGGELTFAARMDQYRGHVARLNTAHRELAKTEHEAWRRYRDLDASDLADSEPAHRSVQLDRPRWQRFTALMAVLAMSLGFGMLLIAKRGNWSFVTPEQVRRELSLPVLGVLRNGDATPMSRGLLAYRLQRGMKKGGEWLLAGVAVWLIMLAALDHGFWGELWSDPLGAVAMAWQRTWG